MSFASKNNNRVFTADTTGYEYTNLQSLFEKFGPNCVFKIEALYINTKSKYGEHSVIAVKDIDGCGHYVDMPKHLTNKVKDMLSDEETVSYINDGTAGFIIRKYHNVTYDKDCYSVEFVDIAYQDDLPFTV